MTTLDNRKHRLLLIEDDRDLASGLMDALGLEGYDVVHFADGEEGLNEARAGTCDLLVLDAMLPGLTGFELLRRLRKTDREVPVLMLTARGQEMDRVRGLKLGADDYVTKPFGLMELLARIEALLRRARPPRTVLTVGDLLIDIRARRVQRKNRKLTLTEREFQILELLCLRRDEAVSREQILSHIWGIDEDSGVTTRTVDQHVSTLRRKLGPDSNETSPIETVYGYGYRLRDR